MRPTIVSVLLIAIAGAAPPALAGPLFGLGPLCRDSKGVARPCAPSDRPAAPARQRRARPPAPGASPPPTGTAMSASPRSHRRPVFGIGKLCRDGKGLAKPCT